MCRRKQRERESKGNERLGYDKREREKRVFFVGESVQRYLYIHRVDVLSLIAATKASAAAGLPN